MFELVSFFMIASKTWIICTAVPEVVKDLPSDWFNVCTEVVYRAEERGMSGAVAASVAWHESRFTRNAVSKDGAIGPLQAIPKYCKGADPIDRGLNALEYHLNKQRTVSAALCRYMGNGPGCNDGVRRARLANRFWLAALGG